MALFNVNQKSLGFGSNKINKTGEYECKIMTAAVKKLDDGTLQVEIEVKNREGQDAIIRVKYWWNGIEQAEADRAMSKMGDILTCAGLQEVDPDQNGIIQPLVGKVIGIVFQREEFLSDKKEVITFTAYKGCFDWKSKQTAQEKRDNSPAVELKRFVTTLVELKALKDPVQPAVNHAMPPMQSASVPPVDAEFSEDVPF